MAYCIATECGYAVGVGGNTHSDLMASISVPQIMVFCFAHNGDGGRVPAGYLGSQAPPRHLGQVPVGYLGSQAPGAQVPSRCLGRRCP